MKFLVLFCCLTVGAFTATLERQPVKRSKETHGCPKDFIRLGHRCYFFSKEKATWQAAFYQCLSMKSNLAIIKNKNQDKLIRKTLSRKTLDSTERWLGGRFDWHRKEWKWAVSSKPLSYKGFDESVNQDSENLQWFCIIADPKLEFRWNARSCLESKQFICQKRVQKPKKNKLPKNYRESNILNEIPVPDISNDIVTKEQPSSDPFHIEVYPLVFNSKPVALKKKERKARKKNKLAVPALKQYSNGTVYENTAPAVLLSDEPVRKRRNRVKEKENLKQAPIYYRTYQESRRGKNPLLPNPVVEEYNFGKGDMELKLVWVFLVLVEVASVISQSENLQYRYVCPKNFQNIGKKCYHFSNSSGTWFQAYFNCKDLGDSNFTVFTERYDQRQFEQYLFKNRNRNQGVNSNSYWVGGFKDWKQKRWIYTDGSVMLFPIPKEIRMSERDNWTCLLVDITKKSWKAENCMERRPFICETKAVASVVLTQTDKKVKRKITIDECINVPETLTRKQKRRCLKLLEGGGGGWRRREEDEFLDEPAAVIQQAKPVFEPKPLKALTHICPQNWMSLGNQCYLFSKERVTWTDAHFTCGQINAKLAVIKSKAQDQKLRIFLNGFTEKQERWIGARYNGKSRQWIWALNGKPLKYTGFAQEPGVNGTGSLEWHAIVMDPNHAYKWTHKNEMEKHYYICQVKGRAVKRLNYPRRPSATIDILPERRYQKRLQQRDNRGRNYKNRRINNRNKRVEDE
ncbi:uncharacterized protein LOC126744139 [Anthonomus grandis grandis]|uniref:uncharacterized protein LOC126744139 n=1 Tax=Anthonomus grandis grandis TaxID=2921223 RepID=UPI00216566FB|nr:uncharacterized protein LOC126744139 [Anthonomus grandis grandis]